MKTTPLEACTFAAEYLRKAGFVLVTVSMKSTSCYYSLPDRQGTIRVAIHSRKKDRKGFQHHSGPVISQITFPSGDVDKHGILHVSDTHVEHKAACAIGLYMMKAAQK